MGKGTPKPGRRADLEARAESLRASLEAVGRELADLPPDAAAPDMIGAGCDTCGRGIYVERWTDDWEGLLHCSACFAEVPRWQTRSTE
jgi:hypothetical protein